MNKTLKLIDGATQMPLPTEDLVFFDWVLRYVGDKYPTIKMLGEAFGTEATRRFIMLCHGMTVSVPAKAFWVATFKEVHIFYSLHFMSEDNKKSIASMLAKHYKMTPKNVMITYRKVATAMEQEGKRVSKKSVV